MKQATVVALTETFEGHAQQTDGGVEFWLARDLQHLLGSSVSRNFTSIVSKSKTSREVTDMPSQTILLT